MGRATAIDLVRNRSEREFCLVLVDRERERVESLAQRLNSIDLPFAANSGCAIEIAKFVGDACDAIGALPSTSDSVVATALSWADAYEVTKRVADTGMRSAGIGRPPSDPRGELGELARRSKARIVVGAGLEPGLTEILLRSLADRALPGCSLRVYCGGVPQVPRPPLFHVLWYGQQFPLSSRPTYAVHGGMLETVARYSGIERLSVPDIGDLEAYHDGLLPWLLEDDVLRQARDIEQRTLRWPGFTANARVLDQLGLLRGEQIAVDGQNVSPRQLTNSLLAQHLRADENDEDVALALADADGFHEDGPLRKSIQVTAKFERITDVSGMGTLTGAVLAETVRLLCRNDSEIVNTIPCGISNAYEIFVGRYTEQLLAHLQRLGVRVSEKNDLLQAQASPAFVA